MCWDQTIFNFPATHGSLNDEGRPAPRNTVGLKISWSPSSVRSLLFRRLYLGEVIWNKTKKRNPWGIQQQRKRPEKDWIQIPMPQLRIISESEWKAAHDRLNATRAIYLRGTKGELWGSPSQKSNPLGNKEKARASRNRRGRVVRYSKASMGRVPSPITPLTFA